MADLNALELTGRLTRDPDLRTTPGGDTVCNFRIAVNGFKQDDSDTVFVDCDVWGKQAEACAQYLRKASRVAVQGRLGVRDWTSQDGEARRSVECNSARAFFIESKAEAEAHQQAPPVAAAAAAPAEQPPLAEQPPAQDDDIPF